MVREMDMSESERMAREILTKGNLERTISVDVHSLPEIKRTPSIREISPNKLVVRASHPAVVRQLVGRYVVKKRWPLYKWYVADRPYLVVLIGFVGIATISIIHLLLGAALPHYLLGLSIVADISIGGILVVLSYAIAIRHTKWRRGLIEQLSQLGGLTEFDDDRYEVTNSPSQIAWPFLAFVALMLLILRPAVLMLDFTSYPPIIFFLSLLVSIPSIFVGQGRAIGHNPCWAEIGDEEDELRELTHEEKEIARELKSLITKEIATLQLQDLFQEETECTAEDLGVVFRRTRFPQCRWFTYYEEESRLMFEIHDMGFEEAKRLTVAKLRRLATPMFSQVGLRRRLLVIFNLFFLIMYIMVVAIVGATLGEHLMHVLLILGGIVLGYTTRLNIALHRESQQVLRRLLNESDHMADFDRDYYYENALGDAIRIDVAMLLAYVFAAICIEVLALWVL